MAGNHNIDTVTVTVLRLQLAALEAMYLAERTCEGARRILDILHAKRDEISVRTQSIYLLPLFPGSTTHIATRIA